MAFEIPGQTQLYADCRQSQRDGGIRQRPRLSSRAGSRPRANGRSSSGGADAPPRSALLNRQHQVFVGRAGPHDMGFVRIGLGVVRIALPHAPGSKVKGAGRGESVDYSVKTGQVRFHHLGQFLL